MRRMIPRRIGAWLALALGCLVLAAPAAAQAPATAPATAQAPTQAPTQAPATVAPTAPSPLVQAQREQAAKEAIESSRIYLAEKELQLKIYQLRVKRAEQEDRHAIMTLYKQSVTDVLIFVLVMTLSGGGVYMSYLQFKKTIVDVVGPPGPDGKPAVPLEPSSFKFGLAGVEMSSSIIGLLVLGLSLAFFYLYLDRVYEIRVLPAPPTAQAAAKP
jgi:hypothetical protein